VRIRKNWQAEFRRFIAGVGRSKRQYHSMQAAFLAKRVVASYRRVERSSTSRAANTSRLGKSPVAKRNGPRYIPNYTPSASTVHPHKTHSPGEKRAETSYTIGPADLRISLRLNQASGPVANRTQVEQAAATLWPIGTYDIGPSATLARWGCGQYPRQRLQGSYLVGTALRRCYHSSWQVGRLGVRNGPAST